MIRTLRTVAAAILAAGLAAAFAFGQGAVQQAGPVTQGRVGTWFYNGLLGDPGGANGQGPNGSAASGISELGLIAQGTGTGPFANAGTGPLGTNLCDYDNPPGAAGGFHVLCIGPNSNGGGVIYYNYAPPASPLPLNLCVNTTTNCVSLPQTIVNTGALSTRTVSSGNSDTALTTDGNINWNSASIGFKTENLFACQNSTKGLSVVVNDESSTAGLYPIVIVAAGGNTIVNGAQNGASALISTGGASARLICDGISTWTYRPNYPNTMSHVINVATFGAVGDGDQSTNCSTSGTTLTCNGKTFTALDVGKTGWISYSGPGFNAFPFTFSAFLNSHQMRMSGTPTTAIPFQHVSQWGLSTALGTGYNLGDTAKPNCASGPTCTAVSGGDAVLTVNAIEPVSLPALVAGGSGGTPSASCTLTGTTGHPAAGAYIQVNLTLNGSGVVDSTSMAGATYGNATNAIYLAAMTNQAVEPMTASGSCGALTGVTFNFSGVFGAYNWKLTSDFTGFYTALTCGSAYNLTNITGSGSGSTIACANNTLLTAAASWGTDNTAAFKAAVAAANALNANGPPRPHPIYIPAGLYVSQPLNTPEKGFACIYGDGPFSTNILMEPNIEGDMFSFLDSTQTGRQLGSGTYVYANDTNPASAGVCGLSTIMVIGDRSSSQLQAGERFYGGNAWMHQDYYYGFYIRGPCISIGYGDGGSPGGTLHESWFRSNRCEYSGDPGGLGGDSTPLPSIQLVNVGTGEQENNLRLSEFRIYDSFGPGIQIASCGGVNNNSTSDIGLDQSHIEFSGMDGAPGSGDNLMLGEPNCLKTHFRNYNGGTTLGSAIWPASGVQGFGNNFTHPRANYCAIHLTAANPANAIGNNNVLEAQFTGAGGALGMGVCIGSGTNNHFTIGQSNMFDYSLQVVTENYWNGSGTSPGQIGPGNAYDDTGNGNSSEIAKNIEAAEQPQGANPVQYAMYASAGGHPTPPIWVGTQTVTYGNSNTNTSLFGTGVGATKFGTNGLNVGSRFLFTASGVLATKASSPGNLTFTFGLAGVTIATATIGPPANITSALPYNLELQCTVFSIGPTAQVYCDGTVKYPTSNSASTTFTTIPWGSSSSPATIDTTTNNVMNFKAQWQTQDPANTLTHRQTLIAWQS